MSGCAQPCSPSQPVRLLSNTSGVCIRQAKPSNNPRWRGCDQVRAQTTERNVEQHSRILALIHLNLVHLSSTSTKPNALGRTKLTCGAGLTGTAPHGKTSSTARLRKSSGRRPANCQQRRGARAMHAHGKCSNTTTAMLTTDKTTSKPIWLQSILQQICDRMYKYGPR